MLTKTKTAEHTAYYSCTPWFSGAYCSCNRGRTADMEAKRAGKHIVRDGGIYADGSIDFLIIYFNKLLGGSAAFAT